MFQNGQAHFKNFAAFAARLLKYVWQFWDIMLKGLIHTPDKIFITCSCICFDFFILKKQGYFHIYI